MPKIGIYCIGGRGPGPGPQPPAPAHGWFDQRESGNISPWDVFKELGFETSKIGAVLIFGSASFFLFSLRKSVWIKDNRLSQPRIYQLFLAAVSGLTLRSLDHWRSYRESLLTRTLHYRITLLVAIKTVNSLSPHLLWDAKPFLAFANLHLSDFSLFCIACLSSFSSYAVINLANTFQPNFSRKF